MEINTGEIESIYSSLISTTRNILLIFSISIAFTTFSTTFKKNKFIILTFATISFIFSFIYGFITMTNYQNIISMLEKLNIKFDKFETMLIDKIKTHLNMMSFYIFIILVTGIITFVSYY